MNAKQAHKLLNVARAVREGDPKNFTMDYYGHYVEGSIKNTCGTPACALGHYAARRDLQKTMRLSIDGEVCNAKGKYIDAVHTASKLFGITEGEGWELFDSDGCGNAHTPKAAARYIERFVARKMKENTKGAR